MPDDVTTPATGTDQNGAGPTPPKTDEVRSFTQDHVNNIAAKEHRRGAKEAISAFLAERQLSNIEELDARLQAFKPDEQKSRAAEKQKLEAERQEMAAKIQALQVKLDEETVKNTVFPVLASLNVRKPNIALVDIRETTGNSSVVKDGRVVVVDKDGDKVSDDVPKWLTEQIKQDSFAMHVKPTVAASPKSSGKPGNGAAKPAASGETFIDRMRASLAAAQSGQDGED